MALSPHRRAFLPPPTLPLVYFAAAHVALAVAAAILVVRPDLPGAFHYHPRMIAVVHLVTLGWISASILGAFYIVAPLAFGMPFPARGLDGAACGSFWVGTVGMICGFWHGHYLVVGIASTAVLAAVMVVAVRALRGLASARLPRGVALHVALAFVNIVIAGSAGLWMAVTRAHAVSTMSPIALAAAHAHVALLGWAVMMIIGVAYRLVPMFLPAAMPTGASLAWSAILLEAGTAGLVWALLTDGPTLPWALVITAAFGVFAGQARRIVSARRPRPVGMSGRDWSAWQTHTAMLWLLAATIAGLTLAAGVAPAAGIWIYGVAGIVGFAAQIVVGIQGRLLPIHAWYRAMTQRDGAPPPRSAHAPGGTRLTIAIFLLWLVAVPGLAVGLATETSIAIAPSALLVLGAVGLQAVRLVIFVRRAADPA